MGKCYSYICPCINLCMDKAKSSSQGFPRQQLPYRSKGKAWRKSVLDWADDKTFRRYSPVRQSVLHKKVSFDLLNGKLHMDDLMRIVNPDGLDATFIPETLQHYPIMNAKINLLLGEESKRTFEWRAIVTNPNSVSEIAEAKKQEFMERLQESIERNSPPAPPQQPQQPSQEEMMAMAQQQQAMQVQQGMPEEQPQEMQMPENQMAPPQQVPMQDQSQQQLQQETRDLSDYFMYKWQDLREKRANCLLNHYAKEQNFRKIFNDGFRDALAVGEEIYQCDIVGGEPMLYKLNPLKVRAFRSGYSSSFEDADIIIIEDYWSPGKIIDTFYDMLSPEDMKYIEHIPDNLGDAGSDSMGNIHELGEFIPASQLMADSFPGWSGREGQYGELTGLFDGSLLPYDLMGNIRVMQVYWKSRRKVQKIKRYDELTGEEEYDFMPEDYIPDVNRGEESETMWINEAWEGTKIGSEIYVGMRPRPVQYNRLTNPSRCHFGIIGSVYAFNGDKPYSVVDIMKPYSYLYDVIHDRLNRLIARNWGNLISLDLAQVPKGWEIDKWLYYAKTNGLYVRDSFKEGNIGAATGKLAGAVVSQGTGVIPAADGNTIQQYMQLLTWIKEEMSDACGVSRQREGQISNRETVGGVERATLQSSHITEWLFVTHDDVKRRVLECFIETAKIALRGKSKKFEYIAGGDLLQLAEIDGDEFAENDYGIVVDNSNGTQALAQQITTLAQAALQNQTLSFSTIMKLYSSASLSEKMRIVETEEQRQREAAEKQQQAQQQQAQAQLEEAKAQRDMMLQMQERQHTEDNETKIRVAEIAAEAKMGIAEGTRESTENMNSETLKSKDRQADEKMRVEREKIAAAARRNNTNRNR